MDIKTLHKGQVRSARAVEAVKTVEHLETLKRNNQTNPWVVIEACLNLWADSNPTAYRSFLYEIEGIKNTRRDKKFATSTTGSMRYTLDIPEKIIYMIRMLYSEEELPMNKAFFHEWATRFPKMKIAEKL